MYGVVAILDRPIGPHDIWIGRAGVRFDIPGGQILASEGDEGVPLEAVQCEFEIACMGESATNGQIGPGGHLQLGNEVGRPLVGPEVRVLVRLGILQQVPVIRAARPLEQSVSAITLVRADDRAQREVAIPIRVLRRRPFLESKGRRKGSLCKSLRRHGDKSCAQRRREPCGFAHVPVCFIFCWIQSMRMFGYSNFSRVRICTLLPWAARAAMSERDAKLTPAVGRGEFPAMACSCTRCEDIAFPRFVSR